MILYVNLTSFLRGIMSILNVLFITPVRNEVNAKYRVPMHPGNSGQLKNKFPGLEKEKKKENILEESGNS